MSTQEQSETITAEPSPVMVHDAKASAKSERKEVYERLHTAADALKERFIARDQAIDLAMMALITGEHVFYLSPPGTAKSAIISAIASMFNGRVHSTMLREDTKVEELLGMWDVAALERGEYRRKYAKLATADFAYLNECFKGCSYALNALLGVLNERQVEDESSSSGLRRIPLRTAMLDSNELPNDMGVLGAFFDRILFKLPLDYIQDEPDFLDLLRGGDPIALPPLPSFQLSELDLLKEAVTKVSPVDEEKYLKTCWGIHQRLRGRNITISDRTWAKACGLTDVNGVARPTPVRAHALYVSRSAKMRPFDLLVLENVLWRLPEERAVIRTAIQDALGKEYAQLAAIINEARDKFTASITPISDPNDGSARRARMSALSAARIDIGRLAKNIDGLALDETEKEAAVSEIGGMLAKIEKAINEARNGAFAFTKAKDE